MVRFKQRYLLIHIRWLNEPRKGIKEIDLYRAVRKSLEVNFGDYGLGLLKASFQIKYWNAQARYAIIRCDEREKGEKRGKRERERERRG